MEESDQKVFSGKRILIVEDEYYLADETRRRLEDLGATIVGPTAKVGHALGLIGREHIDAAILDVCLGDELVFAVADELEERDINFVFATGYDGTVIPAKYKGGVLCGKPIDLEKVAAALSLYSS
ncbi:MULTISPECIES: response regulator [Rhizobium]|uniref:Response regulator n=1 Tax=Rhizobium bangladeshense TaxID=1138189 RepID=A0ABS7LI32_9HYPH|nr:MULTISPECIES: response regulator [Rhizobium]MBX4867379.1 response regulator [Rhizobium bangladeshense]MBX4871671.1 response regulator [Rhizobium bangladeshense]MBX4882985.1 response regulator [Rhizobium bangladeshense]MBX4891370.1 response regulator [Rhizobium bangladeshense]MBX4896846.1 response regulator [Rhizobium bangladeshense]